ncbi:ABC transporter substrate-binding protein [Methylobrevis albus]|uniref:ABC transporter substrate-binding protein n=1 Tax=Methylobrevis albus TaxID=2793297 RepID=A0A931MYT6_9HYPH|nr:ABC transporter substrate-binding protein [Methylobrevis albus]MBH0237324.1 ABC transporter substrate-binding protein [Methylobrevis albus]
MQRLLASTVIAAGLFTAGAFAAGGAAAEECGTVTIANMNWQSAEVLAWIDQIILSEGYGCDAELVPGDTTPTLTSMMEKGAPDVAPEAWINAAREPLDKAVAEGRLHYASESLSEGGVEGFWIPKYLADANPEIKTVDDALAHPELFPAPEDPSKGAVYNCPAGWGCQILTTNFFKAYNAADKGFDLVDTGSAAGLDGSIAKAYEREQGWLGYYWAPTAILGKYEMVRLSQGEGLEHDKAEWDRCNAVADCADPKPNAWSKSEVYTVVTDRFKQAGGPAYEYLTRRTWENATVNKLLAWMVDNQATGEDGAKHFLAEQPDVWEKWVSPEAAEKVKAAL